MFYIACFILAFAAGGVVADRMHVFRYKVESAIRQCEAELPRNQSCEYVISARVKQGNNND